MPLECRIVNNEWKDALIEFFYALIEAGDNKYFHPHPLTEEYAEYLTNYKGEDLYYIIVYNRRVIAYGMLRGWDEGYQIPSLGIAVHPEERGKKVGQALMHFLHTAAYYKNTDKIRLKVYKDNIGAIKLYTRTWLYFFRRN